MMQKAQRAGGPARIDFTKRFMERHGQDETKLYLRKVSFGNKSWAGLVGRGWSPTEITVAVLEQNGGYAHVSHTPGMGTYIDWLITPEGTRIGNDERGGLQFYVNRSLPFIVQGGKVVWLNADNPILMENDLLEWRYDPYTQEMPDILGKKEKGGCMGGANVADLTKLRVRVFGGYDPLEERITMLPPLPAGDRQALVQGHGIGFLQPALGLRMGDFSAREDDARHEFGAWAELEMRSLLAKPPAIGAKVRMGEGKRLQAQEKMRQEARRDYAAKHEARLQGADFKARGVSAHAEEKATARQGRAAAAAQEDFAPREAGATGPVLGIPNAVFDGGLGAQETGAGKDSASFWKAQVMENAGKEAKAEAGWRVGREAAPGTGQGAPSPGLGSAPRTSDYRERGRRGLKEGRKECTAKEKEGKKKAMGRRSEETRKKVLIAEKPEARKCERSRMVPGHSIAPAKKGRAALAKAAAPDAGIARCRFRKNLPITELRTRGPKRERAPPVDARRSRGRKGRSREAVAGKRRAVKKRPGKGRWIEYLLMQKASRSKRKAWLAISRR